MTTPGQPPPHQGDVLISNPSPLTGERELHTVVSADIYNTAGGPTVLVAEIDYGVVLADRVIWLPIDMLGEHFGELTTSQRTRVINQIVAVLRGN